MRLAAGVILVLAAAACGGGATPSAAPAAAPAKTSLTMAVLPTKQVQQSTAKARPIADYISAEVGVPVAVEVPGGYGEVVSGLHSNDVDVAWVSALAYVAIRKAAPSSR